MKAKIQPAMVSIIVSDQERALSFYTEKLGLEKRVDVLFGPGLRWLTVAPRGQKKPEIALARPDEALHGEERTRELMDRIGQPIPWILNTKNCYETYRTLLERGVHFLSAPTKQLHGVEAVCVDPDGNAIVWLEPFPKTRSVSRKRRAGTAA